MRISLDSETTGLDSYHGAKPYLVTVCKEDGEQLCWEWYVDPRTREVRIPPGDIQEIRELIHTSERIIGQNLKFDARMLEVIGITDFPWHKVDDTLIAGHLLASNQSHKLEDMVVDYLGVNIRPYEERMKKACMKARTLSRNKDHRDKGWRIAKAGLPEMPSAKQGGKAAKKGVESDSPWKFDTWLPQSLAYELNLPIPYDDCTHKFDEDDFICDHCEGHHWWTVTSEYANVDSSITLLLWQTMERELERRKLWKLYHCRMKVLPIAQRMESRGVTISSERLEELTTEYRQFSEDANNVCINIAKGLDYELEMPASASPNQSLRTFVADVLKLPPIYNPKARSAAPTLNADALKIYASTLPERSRGRAFIKALLSKRSRDTAVAYMEGYKNFWKPLHEEGCDGIRYEIPGWYILHPSLNCTGTFTLRWSSNSPNEQNISAKEDFNLRYVFGPAPGREWWSLDAKNIELRIPAYESGEQAFIDLFERPNDPPYFGSNHLLISHALFPEEFEKFVNDKGQVDGRLFKKKHEKGIYRKVKGFNFAVQYGAVDREDGEGTADRTIGIPGAQARVKSKFVKQEALNQQQIRFANKYGYVETIPDRSIDPDRGYPILCTRTDYGKIKPTVPLNYHVQSTACWWMMRAMQRCDEQLLEWNRQGFDGHVIMMIHDELVFDFPKRADPRTDLDPTNKAGMKLFRKSNLWRVRRLQELMSLGGDDIGVPTPVSAEYHPVSWDTGITL